MSTLTGEDIAQVIHIVKEIVNQEFETKLPIHREIVDLKSAVKELIEAQKRTEEKLEGLAEAQRRTEERLERLEKVVEGLAEAQRKTEERLNTLAEAQRRTEERLERLEKIVEGLAEAQRRTEESLRELTLVVRDLQKQVGGIAHAIGFQLEDRAYISLPRLLKRDFGIEVKERLVRRYLENKKRERLEIKHSRKGRKRRKRTLYCRRSKGKSFS